jgi:hypothetical protein
MPPPIVLRHIAQRGIDTALCGDSMGSSRELHTHPTINIIINHQLEGILPAS